MILRVAASCQTNESNRVRPRRGVAGVSFHGTSLCPAVVHGAALPDLPARHEPTVSRNRRGLSTRRLLLFPVNSACDISILFPPGFPLQPRPAPPPPRPRLPPWWWGTPGLRNPKSKSSWSTPSPGPRRIPRVGLAGAGDTGGARSSGLIKLVQAPPPPTPGPSPPAITCKRDNGGSLCHRSPRTPREICPGSALRAGRLRLPSKPGGGRTRGILRARNPPAPPPRPPHPAPAPRRR